MATFADTMIRYLFLLSLLFFTRFAYGQVPDSLPPRLDTVRTPVDSPRTLPDSLNPVADSIRKADSLGQVPFINDSITRSRTPVQVEPPRMDPPRREVLGKDWYFYVLIFLMLVLGVLKNLFPKYFADLFRIFFRRTLKQRQLYEQLIQTPLPSLMLNLFFLVTGGIYLSYLLHYFDLEKVDNFWIQALYATGVLAIIYMGKYATLKFSGWLFNLNGPADDYSFLVFMINKMIGILLLPCLVLILLSAPGLAQFSLYLSFVLLGLVGAYRILLTFQLARNRVKVNLFHFLLYILGFEIIPLLLIYKLLLLVI